MCRQQDRQLDDVDAAVGRIGRMGGAIGEEMEDQVRVREAFERLGQMVWGS